MRSRCATTSPAGGAGGCGPGCWSTSATCAPRWSCSARRCSMPVCVAPVAFQRLVDPDGEVAMARAAAAAGTVMSLSTIATARPSEVAAGAPGGRRFFQLYSFRDEAVTRALMEEAVESGFEAILLTVDAPVPSLRERDLRTGFAIPPEVRVPSLEATLGGGKPVTVAEVFAQVNPALDWQDLYDLASECSVPVLAKGGLHGRGCCALDRARSRGRRRLQPRRPSARLRRGECRRARRGRRGGGGAGDGDRRRRNPARDGCRRRPGAGSRCRPRRPAGALGPRRGRRGRGAAGAGDAARGAAGDACALRVHRRPRTSPAGTSRGARPAPYIRFGCRLI